MSNSEHAERAGQPAAMAANPTYENNVGFYIRECVKMRQLAPEMLAALETVNEALLRYEQLANDGDEASRRHGEAIRTPLNLAISYVQAARADS